MGKSDELAKRIKDVVNEILFDKRIDRPTLIEAFEDAAGDLEGVIESLKDDERRASSGKGE
jgi:hypothetical protein